MNTTENHNNTNEIYENIWKCLDKGVNDRFSDYHTFSLATAPKNIVEVRTVVLRGYDRKNQSIIFHTNNLTSKISEIKNNSNSRRLILSAWNPNQINEMALPPCHTLAQFRVMNGKLSCQLYQRSADMFLGVPFNIASYSLLTHMLAQICNLELGTFVWVGGDCHIYKNHMEQVAEQLKREPQNLPNLHMPLFKNLHELLKTKPNDYVLENYNPLESIKAPMAV